MVKGYLQYKDDFFNKLSFPFKKGKKILDVGCGDGTDAEVFVNEYKLDFVGTDIYLDENLKRLGYVFKKGSIDKLPLKDDIFDYVYVHDVLHHIDEHGNSARKITEALSELRRVCKRKGEIVIIEGNRYNPLFYPHMVKMKGHNHLSQSFFITVIISYFNKDTVQFKFFEAHSYPSHALFFFKLYEYIMEHISPKKFLAYNVAIIQKT